MVYQIMDDAVDGQNAGRLLILIDNRQMAVSRPRPSCESPRRRWRLEAIAAGGLDMISRTGADKIAAAGHLLERIALGENADELGAFANHDGARALRTKKLQHVADGFVGSRSQGLIGVGGAYALTLQD